MSYFVVDLDRIVRYGWLMALTIEELIAEKTQLEERIRWINGLLLAMGVRPQTAEDKEPSIRSNALVRQMLSAVGEFLSYGQKCKRVELINKAVKLYPDRTRTQVGYTVDNMFQNHKDRWKSLGNGLYEWLPPKGKKDN